MNMIMGVIEALDIIFDRVLKITHHEQSKDEVESIIDEIETLISKIKNDLKTHPPDLPAPEKTCK